VSQEADLAAMERLREAYDGSFNRGDLDAWLENLTDDCVILVHGVPALVGKDAVGSFYAENFFEPFDCELTWDFEELEFFGDSAYGWGWFHNTLSPKDGGEPQKLVGKFIDIFRKTADGEWKLARLSFNADHE
jgi:uncharacterized protein (TIGR02246 family)